MKTDRVRFYYHMARQIDRGSILRHGLLLRRPQDKLSCAELVENPAGAGVYLYKDIPPESDDWWGFDCWQVSLSDEPLEDPLAYQMLAQSLVHPHPVSKDAIELIRPWYGAAAS